VPLELGADHALVTRAIVSGAIRKNLDPFDLLRALVGVSNVASGRPRLAAKRQEIGGYPRYRFAAVGQKTVVPGDSFYC